MQSLFSIHSNCIGFCIWWELKREEIAQRAAAYIREKDVV
jgi:hypothetical protein